jgi:hypothetical protein
VRWPLLSALVLGLGCAQPVDERAAANAAAAEVAIDGTLRVRVFGGAIVEAAAEQSADDAVHVRVRAQSLDVRVDVLDSGCAPRTVEITVTHLPADGVAASWTPLLDALALEVLAAREAGGAAVDFVGDPHDRDRTPLDRAPSFVPANGVAADVRRWWVTTDRGRQSVVVEAAPPVARAGTVGACATANTDAAGPLGSAALVARHRLQYVAPAGGWTFAVWGNNAGDVATRDLLLASVRARAPRFAIISGDLTATGRPAEVSEAVMQLDQGLDLPWFATVGDRDVRAELAGTLVRQLGRTTFVLDVGGLRIIVLDSADKALSAEAHTGLDAWLELQSPLWWSEGQAPASAVVITHVPPFDPYGARGDGFNQRLEAGRMLAELRRAQVPYLITSQLATWETVPSAGVTVVHSGGAGAPIEGGSSAVHHWLAVHVAEGCLNLEAWSTQPEEACGGLCDVGQACAQGACVPCVTLEQVPF